MKRFLPVFAFAILALPAFSQTKQLVCTLDNGGQIKLKLDEGNSLVWQYWNSDDKYVSYRAAYTSENVKWQINVTNMGPKNNYSSDYTLDRVTGRLGIRTVSETEPIPGHGNISYTHAQCEAVEKKF